MKNELVKHTMKWGVLIFLVYAPVMVFSLMNEGSLSFLEMPVLVAGLYLALLNYKKTKDEFTYGANVGYGAVLGIFLGVFTGTLSYLMINHIQPELIDILAEQQIKVTREFLEAMKMDPLEIGEEIEKAKPDLYHSLRSPLNQLMSGIFSTTLIMVVISLILGIFNRKKKAIEG